MKVSTLLDQIDDGQIALPEFQRGYVWTRDQVRDLITSLYRRYPVGSLMVWTTAIENADIRHDGDAGSGSGTVKLLLDGQQRITTLYGVVRARPPRFFEGNKKAFTGLYFHLGQETFEFYGPVKMKNDPLWISVTQLFGEGLDPWFERLGAIDGLASEDKSKFFARLGKILGILDVPLHVESIEGPDKTVDIVVDVFNRVNSGGTSLSKGDLALAKICATWPDARQTMNDHLDSWRNAGFEFKLEWLLRVANAVLTGEAFFSALKDMPATEFAQGLGKSAAAINQVINLVSTRMGLDHARVFAGRGSVPVMARYLAIHAEKFPRSDELDKLLFWYGQSMIWGRHSGSSETTLQQDLRALDDGGLDKLVEVLRDSRGDLSIRPANFDVSTLGSRFYPLMYLLSRVWGARDLATGNELSAHMLGKLARLEVHHLFPRAVLAKHGHTRTENNAIANYALLTQESNLAISDTLPSQYFRQMEEKHPGVLASQWIPQDPALWELDRYRDFLAARRELLAAAANEFFAALLGGTLEAQPEQTDAAAAETLVTTGTSVGSEAEQPLHELKEWFSRHDLPTPELFYEITNDDGSEVLVEVDAAWPDGIQAGLGKPVAFLLEHDRSAKSRLQTLHYEYFSSVAALKDYALRLLGEDSDDEPEDDESEDLDNVDVDAATEDEVHVGMDRILALADSNGLRDAIDRALEVADRHRLGKRAYKKSLMLTPPANKTKVLVNIAIVGLDQTNTWVSDGNWEDYYDVEMTEVNEAVDGVGRKRLDSAHLTTLLGQVDDLLSSIDEIEEPDVPPIIERIVTFLHGEPGMAFAADDVADRVNIRKRLAVKRLSRLVSPRCPAKYSGAVERLDNGTYRARTTSAQDAPPATTSAPPTVADPSRSFHEAMLDIARRSKSEAGYNPTLFISMLNDRGGVATARSLLAASGTSDGFAALWERGRLDLTMESVVLRPEFAELFTTRELDVARRRLADHRPAEDRPQNPG